MKTLALTCLVAVATTVQAVTGFGGNVLSLSVGGHLIDLRLLVAAVVLTGPLQVAPILWLDRKEIRHRIFWRRLLPLCLVGLSMGLSLSAWIPTEGLPIILGVVVIALSTRELIRTLRKEVAPPPFSPAAASAIYLFGGLIHGLIATGGPIIVYAVARQITDKRGLRGTLAALWLVLNSLMIAVLLPRLAAPVEALKLAGWLLPGVAVGLAVGQWLHHRVPERTFRLSLFSLLILAGLAAFL